MQYSYNWLKQLSGTTKDPKELAKMVGLKGFELEEVEAFGKKFEGFVVGEILEIKKHPDADKLQLVKVDTGDAAGELEIVCGAHNIKVGDKVPVALVGAVLPSSKLTIEKRKVRGEVSNGMLCAEDELALGKDHEGILILSGDAKTGQPLVEVLELADSIVEFDILPDRAHDCLSYEGMAREIAAMEGRDFQISNFKFQISNEIQNSKSETLDIQIEDEKGCPRYIGAVLEDVKVGPSPRWMQNRLLSSGMEPINNVVDITNYVMLEVGNPLHAFDFGKISGEITNSKDQIPNKSQTLNSKAKTVKIVVRRAKKGEELELLDDTVLELDESDLVIADDGKAVGLAGIKGGKFSGISKDTTQIVLESANFDGFGIRKSRQRHSLLTEAQARFEKGLSPKLAQRAIMRAIELLEEHAGAELVQILDVDKSSQEKQIVDFHFDSISKLLGFEVDRKEVFSILENLGFEIEGEGDVVKVDVPDWRLDIEGQADLIEEVGRIVGYEKIQEKPMTVPVSIPSKNKQRIFEWKTREALLGIGLDEVRNYSFYGSSDAKNCGLTQEGHFELEMPLSKDLNLMRLTLIPGLLKNIAHNIKFFDRVGVFELGRVYLKKEGNVPDERLKIAAALLDRSYKNEEGFFDFKGQLETLLKRTACVNVFFVENDDERQEIFHKTRSAKIMLENEENVCLGTIGEIVSGVAKKYGIKERLVCFELDLETLWKASDKKKEFIPLRKYPTAVRDISMYVPMRTEVREIINVIQKAGGKDMIEADLFDVYVDKKQEKKSLAFHLSFGKSDGTMEGKEIDKLIDGIISDLEKNEVEVRKG